MGASKIYRLVLASFIVSLVQGVSALGQTPTAPSQPLSGPGGSNYPFGTVTTNGPYWANGRMLQDQFKYYIFEPSSPTPLHAPVILFIHGFIAITPSGYQGWINHMVKKGYVVVWVQYQTSALTPTKSYTTNARTAWADALYRLQNFWWESHVRPIMGANGQPQTMIVAHSVGGWIGANIAATVGTSFPAVPTPLGLVAIEPGTKSLVPGEDFSKINPSTALVEVVGDADTVVCKNDAIKIFNQTPQIPASFKNLLWMQSDARGTPAQVANHFFPNTDGFNDNTTIDNRDFNITWKLSVGTAECVFGTGPDPGPCVYGLGAGNLLQVWMGRWSDGVPVKPMVYFANPTTLPAIPGCP